MKHFMLLLTALCEAISQASSLISLSSLRLLLFYSLLAQLPAL